MMKKLVSLLLVAVMLATMAPIYAFAYDEEEYFARYDVSLKSTSTNWIDGYYFTYTIGGKEFRSDLMGSEFNYKAWTMMTDADKKKAAKVFFNRKDRDEAFGAKNSAEVAEFVSSTQGYTAVANKLKENVERKYIDNELMELFSDTIVDKDEDLSYFQRTINTEFEIEDYDEVVYKYEFFIDSHAAKQAYAKARFAMDSGHEIYRKLKSLRELAWQMSVKATAGELGKYLANNAIVPPITPGATMKDLTDAAWSFAKDLASQLGYYKTKSDIIQDLLYGKDIVSKDDACKIIKEVNELAEMYEAQCHECYAEAKYQISYVKQLMKNLEKLNADYDKKVEEYRIQAEKDREEATNPEPNTTVQDIIEEEIDSFPLGTNPGPDKSTNSAEYNIWANRQKAYQSNMYNRAVAIKSASEDLEQQWNLFADDYAKWRETWADTLKKVIDDGIPEFPGEYIKQMVGYYDYFYYHRPENGFCDSSSEYNLIKKSATNTANYYDYLSLYFSRHFRDASSVLETEMEKYKALNQRYLDIYNAYRNMLAASDSLRSEIVNYPYWYADNIGNSSLRDAALQALNEVKVGYCYIGWLESELGNVSGEVEIKFTDITPLVETTRYSYYLSNWRDKFDPMHTYTEYGYYGFDTDNNTLSYYYVLASADDFFNLLESQLKNKESVRTDLTTRATALRAAFDTYNRNRNMYIDEMKEAVRKYYTARDNYDLARRKYMPAYMDYANLQNNLPDYVTQQKLITVANYLKTSGRDANPIIYDDLYYTTNRASTIVKYRNQLTTYYNRYKKDLRIMENAYSSMEQAANEMSEQYSLFCWMHPGYDYGQGTDYFRDLGVFRPSQGADDEYEDDYCFGLVPRYSNLNEFYSMKYSENSTKLIALYKDFAGVSQAQADADLATHMLLINKSAIIHECKNGNTKRLDAIYKKYQNAKAMAYYYSWVGLGEDGQDDEDFIKTYNSILNSVKSYVNVNKLSKGNTSKAKARAMADLEIQEGKSGQLYATVEPSNATDKTIIWASKTPDIATVDSNGRVTALNDGEAIIIAYPADSIAVPIDTEGNELDEDDDGTPIVPNSSAFGGYTYKLPDENGELESAVLEYVVNVTADPTPGAEWNKVKPYNDAYDGNCHLAIETAGLNNYDVAYSTDGGESYTEVCPIIDAVGDYNIAVKLTPIDEPDSKGEVREFTASISKLDITGKEIDVLYGEQAPVDGEEHEVVISRIIVDGMEMTAENYKIVSGNKASTITPQSIVVSGQGNFKGTSAPSAEKWTLKKDSPTAEDFNIAPIKAVDYTGNAVEIAAPTAKKDGMGNVIVKYNGSTTAPVDAGEYTVTFDVEEGEKYAAARGFEIGTLVINKVDYNGAKEGTGRVEIGYDDTVMLKLPDLPAGAKYRANEIKISGEGAEISDISISSYSYGVYIYCYINAGSEPAALVATIPVRGARNYNDYEVAYTIKVYDPQCNHIWNDGAVTTPPSCYDYGVMTYECTLCGANKYENLDILDHVYEVEYIAPTCTEDGSRTYTCTICGYNYYEPIWSNGHGYATDKAVPATCTKEGLTEGYHCPDCGVIFTEQKPIPKTDHSYATTKATLTKNGQIKCKSCGKVKQTIAYPKTITLSATSYTYDGKAKKPTVTVTDSTGKKIAASNYTVSYASGRKNVGKYSVKITFKGNYSGTKSLTFKINPKGTTVSSVAAASKGFTVKWKKQATQTTGYEIQYSTDKNFKKSNKTVTVSKNSTTSKKISKLSAKKKYYVRVRTYKTVKVNGKSTKIYSAWSKVKTVTTKK